MSWSYVVFILIVIISNIFLSNIVIDIYLDLEKNIENENTEKLTNENWELILVSCSTLVVSLTWALFNNWWFFLILCLTLILNIFFIAKLNEKTVTWLKDTMKKITEFIIKYGIKVLILYIAFNLIVVIIRFLT